MKAFVRQKSIKQISLSSPSKKKSFFFNFFSFVSLKFFSTLIVFFVLIYGVFFLFKKTLFVPEYRIQKIQYATGSLQKFDDPRLYKMIKRYLKGENYYVVFRRKTFILKKIQEVFPIVSDLFIDYIATNTVFVKIDFFEPEMLIKNQDLLFGVYKNYTFRIYSGNTIGSGVQMLYLPLYVSGLTSIDGLFYRQSAKELQQQMAFIYAAFPKAKFVAYLPGAERTVVMTDDNKKVFLNNLGDIAQQVKNFELLKKYYSDYAKLTSIDLGSLEKDKVIVKK